MFVLRQPHPAKMPCTGDNCSTNTWWLYNMSHSFCFAFKFLTLFMQVFKKNILVLRKFSSCALFIQCSQHHFNRTKNKNKGKLTAFSTSKWVSDELVFHVSAISNSQRTCIWDTEHPKAFWKYALNIEKVTVWCALHGNGVLGHIKLITKQSGETIVIAVWTHRSGEMLKCSQKNLF